MLRGPLGAGSYTITAPAAPATAGIELHADVLWRHAGAEDVLATADLMEPPFGDGGAPPIVGSALGRAAAAKCGDLLVLRITYTKGPVSSIELYPVLKIP